MTKKRNLPLVSKETLQKIEHKNLVSKVTLFRQLCYPFIFDTFGKKSIFFEKSLTSLLQPFGNFDPCKTFSGVSKQRDQTSTVLYEHSRCRVKSENIDELYTD